MIQPELDSLRRRQCLLVALASGLPLGLAHAQLGGAASAVTELPALAFLGFELIDDQPDPARSAGLAARIAVVNDIMSKGLVERGLYRVVDLTPAAQQIAKARDETQYLHRCNGCLAPIGAALDVPLVGVGWVQRVGNLILNINLAVWHAADDRMALTKSVDIRGDNEDSWRRGALYMLRDMAERRARQPRYGL